MNQEVQVVDGAFGEGGGQILRTSLSLSAVTQRAVEITNIRAGRGKPGLLRQHLTAVQALAEICGAEVEGAVLKSSRVLFRPGPIQAGVYEFAIGSAGSANLVLQTVLPALLMASGPSTVTVKGGTHNPSSPPFDFLQRVFFPQLERMGAQVQAELLRPGFFPAGGGAVRVTVRPPASGTLGALELLQRGQEKSRHLKAVVANLPMKVAQRELQAFMARAPWPHEATEVCQWHQAQGPGNVIMAELQFEHVGALFTAFGQRGVPAERVARHCAGQVRSYFSHGVPVGEYLADQLLLPMALGQGGCFLTGALSMHTRTNLEVIRQLLGVQFEVREQAEGVVVRRMPA